MATCTGWFRSWGSVGGQRPPRNGHHPTRAAPDAPALRLHTHMTTGRWAPRYRYVELFVMEAGDTSMDTTKHYRQASG